MRYESADNRAKHSAIVNQQLKLRKGGNSFGNDDATEVEDFGAMAGASDGFSRVSLKSSGQQQPQPQLSLNNQQVNRPPAFYDQTPNSYTPNNLIPKHRENSSNR